MSFGDYYGLDLTWFLGVVEDRTDPLKIGRCRVRCLGFHNEDIEELPTEDLPWAQLLIPANSDYEIKPPKEGSWVIGFFKDGKYCQKPMILSLVPGIPIVPAEEGKEESFEDEDNETKKPKPKEFGFYDMGKDLEVRPKPPKDLISEEGSVVEIQENESAELYPAPEASSEEGEGGEGGGGGEGGEEGGEEESELPFMLNIIEEPDTSRVSRNENKESTLIQKRIDWLQKQVPTALLRSQWDEPETKYDTVYPYNNVHQSESGHLFEVDDTRGKERISQQHRSGTFYEIHPDGTKVEKILNENFKIVHGNEYILNFGGLEICIKGEKGELIEGNYYIDVKENIDIRCEAGKRIDLNKHLP